MAEGAVTVDGQTHALPELLIVLATQNPGDMEGTYPLPEAQRDRFTTRISLGYPDAHAEVAMLEARGTTDPAALIAPVATIEEVLAAQQLVVGVHLATEVARYAVAIVSSTRVHPAIALGASPRATLHLARMARARAAIRGRAFVSPDDVAELAVTVLAHRLVMRGHFARVSEAHHAAANAISEIVAHTPLR